MEADHVDRYIASLDRRDLTQNTKRSYAQSVRQFAKVAPALTDVTIDDVIAFSRRTGTPLTQAFRESCLRLYFDWCVDEGLIDRSPMERLDTLRRPHPDALDVITLSTEQVADLIEHSYTLQERLCVGVLVYTGARVSAASRLRWRDFHPVSRTLHFYEKGRVHIEKPVPDALLDLIEEAWDAPGEITPEDYLIPSNGTPRSKERDNRAVARILERVAIRAGVEVHPHVLRAAFAVRFLEENPERLLALQALMGHKRLSTTEGYLRKLNRRNEMEQVRSLTYTKEK